MDETQVEKTNAIHLGGNLVHVFSMDETQVHGFDAKLVATVQSVWCRTLASFAFELRL